MSPARRSLSGQQAQLDTLQPPARGLILDVDGVLWRDTEAIGELAVIFDAIATRGLRLAVATNNAMKTVEDYLHKFRGFGVELEARQIVTSGEATADALAAALPGHGAVFVVGERGIVQALTGRGFDVVTDPRDERPVAAVVVGLDREFTYAQLHKAATLIRQGSLFYGTNPDTTFPMPEGLVPGAGALLAAIEAASDCQPVVVGKPSPLLFEIAAGRIGIPPASILVVGDRLETDIAGGQAFGARTALVLTGVSTLEQVGDWSPPPTIVTPSLSALLGV